MYEPGKPARPEGEQQAVGDSGPDACERRIAKYCTGRNADG